MVEIECVASGAPLPSITWVRQDQTLLLDQTMPDGTLRWVVWYFFLVLHVVIGWYLVVCYCSGNGLLVCLFHGSIFWEVMSWNSVLFWEFCHVWYCTIAIPTCHIYVSQKYYHLCDTVPQTKDYTDDAINNDTNNTIDTPVQFPYQNIMRITDSDTIIKALKFWTCHADLSQ